MPKFSKAPNKIILDVNIDKTCLRLLFRKTHLHHHCYTCCCVSVGSCNTAVLVFAIVVGSSDSSLIVSQVCDGAVEVEQFLSVSLSSSLLHLKLKQFYKVVVVGCSPVRDKSQCLRHLQSTKLNKCNSSLRDKG